MKRLTNSKAFSVTTPVSKRNEHRGLLPGNWSGENIHPFYDEDAVRRQQCILFHMTWKLRHLS